jgi:dienelactone hydrolase
MLATRGRLRRMVFDRWLANLGWLLAACHGADVPRGACAGIEPSVAAGRRADRGTDRGTDRGIDRGIDRAAPGPWPVGVKTIDLEGTMVEVWYPATPGSERGHPHARYDLRDAMPRAEAAKIPDADNAWLECACTRDLPVDDTHGRYPAIVFLHGAASFRAQSASLATHWASRGFVVLAPEMPGIGLAAVMGGPKELPLLVPSKLVALIEHVPPHDPLAFVRGRLGDRLAIVGHSLGALLANAVEDQAAVAVRIALAGAAPNDGRADTLIMVGDHDRIAGGTATDPAIVAAHGWRVVVHRAGHLAFSDLCGVGADRGGSVAIARAHGVEVPELVAQLANDGCGSDDAPFATTAPVIRAATAAVLEQTLRCAHDAAAELHALATRYDVEVLEPSPPVGRPAR